MSTTPNEILFALHRVLLHVLNRAARRQRALGVRLKLAHNDAF